MKKQNGVTLVYLVIIILITIIIASITFVTSLSSFRQMNYEAFRAELEEIQTAVNETCEDYELAKESNSNITDYETYFLERFGISPSTISESINEDGVSDVVEIYAALSATDENIFYFDTSDIKTYFGLETTYGAVLVDFETRYIYSIKGCQDPTNTDVTYYTLSEVDGSTNIYEDTEEAVSSLIGVTASDDNVSELQTVGETAMLKVTLTAKRDSSSGKDYPIKKAYYSIDDGETYVEVDYLGDCVYTEDTVSFVIYDAGTYIFKIEDTYGATAETSQTYMYYGDE